MTQNPYYKLYLIVILTLLFIKCAKEYGDQPYSMDGISDTTLQIEVSEFQNEDGKLVIALFNNHNDFLSETFLDTSININKELTTVLINNIQYGNYAISVFHDEDNNGELTENLFLGTIPIPMEGYGFSNNPPIIASAPSYQDCKFYIESGQKLVVPIELHYF